MRSFPKILAAYLIASVAFGAFLWLCAVAFHPAPEPPPAWTDAEVAEAKLERSTPLHPENPPRIAQQVDYSEGPSATWWPRKDPPVIAGHVAAGRLPPVAERTGPEPVVMEGVDDFANYGGAWERLVASEADILQIYSRLSYPNLVRWSPEGYPIVPHLAREWKVSDDQRVYTFRLRAGMRWSDGHPVSTEDVRYWYEDEVRFLGAVPGVLRNGSSVGRVEVIDNLTFRFVFDEPNPIFLDRVASEGANPEWHGECLVPAHYLRRFHPKLGDPAAIEAAKRRYGLASATAVYERLKEWRNPDIPRLWPWIYRTPTPTAPYVFVRNPFFPAVDSQGRQLPYLDRLVLTIRPSNLFALAAATGRLSLQDRMIRYEDHVLLKSEAARNGYDLYYWYPATRSVFTIFPVINRRVEPDRPDSLWKHRLLNDRRFRQALSLAINRRAIIDALYNGQGEPSQIDPGPDSPFHDPELARSYTAYDPSRANRLLDSIGLTGRDGDGYRTFPDGSRMLWVMNMTEFTSNDPAQFVIDDWARVGIRCMQRVRARSLFSSEQRAFRHDFTVWTGESELMPLIGPRNFVPTYVEAFYAPGFGIWYQHGGLAGSPGASRVPGALAPPESHPIRRSMELLEEIYHTADPGRRMELFRRIERENAENVWHISLATPPPQLVVVKNGLRNVPRNALYGNFYNTPANAGMETFAWENPDDPPETVAQIEQAMIAPHSGRQPGAATAIPAPAGTRAIGILERTLFIMAVAGVGFVAFRHPFVARRLLLMVPTLGIVSIAVFTIVQLPPGDFANSRMMELEMQGTSASSQSIADLRRNFHLDEPQFERYLRWAGLKWFVTFDRKDEGLLQGNLGLSMEHNRPVKQVVGDRIRLTLLISACTILFTWVVAVPIGIVSAVRQHTWLDYGLTFVGFLGMSVPGFLLAIMLMWAANRLLGLDVSGLFSPEFATMSGWTTDRFADLLKHVWLPVVVLGFAGTASMARIMRANLLDELKKPYVTAARARGPPPLRLLLRYPVRLALNPFVSGLGSLFPQLVSGGAIVALVLSLPTVGPLLLDALLAEDVYLAASLLMILSALAVAGTLLSDLLLLWLDPRIRLEEGSR